MNITERLEHYTALMAHLCNEKQRLAAATTKGEIELRSVWVSQLEKEIAHEVKFLESQGVNLYTETDEVDSMSDDDLLNELLG